MYEYAGILASESKVLASDGRRNELSRHIYVIANSSTYDISRRAASANVTINVPLPRPHHPLRASIPRPEYRREALEVPEPNFPDTLSHAQKSRQWGTTVCSVIGPAYSHCGIFIHSLLQGNCSTYFSKDHGHPRDQVLPRLRP